MKILQAIPAVKKTGKPFMHHGKQDTFIRKDILSKINTSRSSTNENKANLFAQKVVENRAIVNAFFESKIQPAHPAKTNRPEIPTGLQPGIPLPKKIADAFNAEFDLDFSAVCIHADELSTKISKEYNAAALTTGHHIFFNTDVFDPTAIDGLMILAHELLHTIESSNKDESIDVKLKPLTELNDRTPEQKLALDRSVKIATGEKGKVNSGMLNQDKTRVGWEYLLEYFKTTLGDATIVKDKSEYKQGKFLEENIKFVRRGKATKVKVKDGVFITEIENNVDLLPSWCGIFIFWALHKGGIHPPLWEIGKPNFTAKDSYRKGEYLPRPGDIVIKNGYNHHAMVVRTDPVTITDTKDLKNVKVITINGNTAGANHQGGQIQEKTDPYSYWDFYINPFFKGVTLTPESDFKIDERLKKSVGDNTIKTPGSSNLKPADLSVNQYSTTLEPIGNLDIAKAETEKKDSEVPAEEPVLDPKAIMAKDTEFKELHSTLDKNADKQKDHDTPENKADEAQTSAVSPGNERMSRAKALKVEKLGEIAKPKQFKAAELKENILKEVDKLLKEKEKEANDTGEKPKISNEEINDVKGKNNEDIKLKKKESIGAVEEKQKIAPDDSTIDERKNGDVVIEDPGAVKKIPSTEKAVAKPVDEERITLEKESAEIDDKMYEHDVDDEQLRTSEEDQFVGAQQQKEESQAQAASVKDEYRNIEKGKLDKDKKLAKYTINTDVEKIHDTRKGEFGNVNSVKDNTKKADELKRKEVSDAIEKIYNDSEKSVDEKLTALETSVSEEFDGLMTTANGHFKDGVNNALDEEFTWEWAAKKLDRDDYNRRVKKIFVNESAKYKQELSDALNPLTNKIANTLNAIINEIHAAKEAVKKYVDGLDPSLAEVGVQSAKAVLEKFNTLEESVDEKQNALTNNLAKKYADGVIGLEKEFKAIMDERKSWLEKALDAIVDAIMEIVNLFRDLYKALERAAEYGKRIIKAPLKFFGNLVKGATAGFDNFVKNIAKHLLQGALEWVTGEMGDAGIQLPEKFDFKGILSIILQVLGISVNHVKEIAKKVIGAKYVALLEKGADLGVKAADKVLQIFSIIKKDGIAGLWEFIQEQFADMKEKLMEEAKAFMITTIIEAAVIKIVSMLIPGAGFISAVKSLIDFLRTLFAKARQIVNIIIGIIDTFGEILAGNVSKVSSMIEDTLAKFLSLAITFLAAILGLGKVGKKINEIIQKKIKDPITKAITKMMEKLKVVMTKLGIFKFLDKAEEKIKKGAKWVDDKKEKVKDKAKEALGKVKGFLKGLFTTYKDENGETHKLRFKDTELYRESVSVTLGNYLLTVKKEISGLTDANEKKKHTASVEDAFDIHDKIVKLIGKNISTKGNEYKGSDEGFSEKDGKTLRIHLQRIAKILAELPLKNKKNLIPETIIKYPKQYKEDGEVADATFISLNSPESGSQPSVNSSLTKKMIEIINAKTKTENRKLVRGHLINHELFGTGAKTKNLAPIPKKANSAMLSEFETDAKKLVHANNVITLDVTMNYGLPNDKQLSGKSLLQNKLPSDTKIPVSVTYNLQQLQFAGPSKAKPAEINDFNKWGQAGFAKAGDIPINHDDFF